MQLPSYILLTKKLFNFRQTRGYKTKVNIESRCHYRNICSTPISKFKLKQNKMKRDKETSYPPPPHSQVFKSLFLFAYLILFLYIIKEDNILSLKRNSGRKGNVHLFLSDVESFSLSHICHYLDDSSLIVHVCSLWFYLVTSYLVVRLYSP